MTERWLLGTWLGKRFTTDEHVIALEDGKVVRTRSVKCKPEGDTWRRDKIESVTGKKLGTQVRRGRMRNPQRRGSLNQYHQHLRLEKQNKDK